MTIPCLHRTYRNRLTLALQLDAGAFDELGGRVVQELRSSSGEQDHLARLASRGLDPCGDVTASPITLNPYRWSPPMLPATTIPELSPIPISTSFSATAAAIFSCKTPALRARDRRWD